MRRLVSTLILALAVLPAAAVAQSGGGGAPPGSTGPTQPPQPPPPPAPTPKLVVGKPVKRLFVREGSGGRLQLAGTWYFRQDDALQGERRRFFAQRSLAGWTAIRVPHSWNASDTTRNAQGTGWYRREFKLPRPRRGRRQRWKIRFESAINGAKVWLNGRFIGSGRPGYLPFELDLKGLRRGRNRLVVRVSSRRSKTDLTHWRVYGNGGWWNFGGLAREVYVRPVDTVDIEDMAVLPRLRRVRGAARVIVRLRVRNLSRRDRRVRIVLTLRGRGRGGRQIRLNPRTIDAMSTREISTSFIIRRPRLWRPRRPNLYRLVAAAAVGDRRRSSFRRYFGVRKIEKRRNGQVLLNGRKLNLRGASIHEDDPSTGAALTPRQRSGIVRSLRRLRATITRAHYPLHPAFLEAFDRYGILYWSQAPVYQLPNSFLNRRNVRGAALGVNRRTVERDRSHPSVLAWSLGNELAFQESEGGRVGPGFSRFVIDGIREVRRLDNTRLVALDRHSRIGEQIYSPALARLDALGVNEYFGWYRTAPASRPPSRTAELGPFLDQIHAAYPRTPLFITEFGAESTVNGPAGRRGTFDYQTDYMRAHLAIHGSRPFVNGSMIWILKDFRVTTTWTGGNDPRLATPPWNNKGLIDQTGARKPGFSVISRLFRRTRPLR